MFDHIVEQAAGRLAPGKGQLLKMLVGLVLNPIGRTHRSPTGLPRPGLRRREPEGLRSTRQRGGEAPRRTWSLRALTGKAYGQDKPVADNSTAEGAYNRRIEFTVVK